MFTTLSFVSIAHSRSFYCSSRIMKPLSNVHAQKTSLCYISVYCSSVMLIFLLSRAEYFSLNTVSDLTLSGLLQTIEGWMQKKTGYHVVLPRGYWVIKHDFEQFWRFNKYSISSHISGLSRYL